MTTSLTSEDYDEEQHTDLGTKEIHQRKSVMIEGGPVPRAQVMDQNVIDKYLMKGWLTLIQHQAGEFYLNAATHAGIFVKAQNYAKVPGGSGDHINYSHAYSSLVKMVKRFAGDGAVIALHDAICGEQDVREIDGKWNELLKGLDAIVDNRLSGGRSPARHLN